MRLWTGSVRTGVCQPQLFLRGIFAVLRSGIEDLRGEAVVAAADGSFCSIHNAPAAL